MKAMQPDEIIQQKEWYQLTGEEKLAIQELAASEQEYNVLKQFFNVAKEEPEAVPEINPAVKIFLQAETVKNKKKRSNIIWYAAAAVLFAAVSTIFILQEQKKIPGSEIASRTKKTNTNVPVPSDTTLIVKTTPANTVTDTPQVQTAETPKKKPAVIKDQNNNLQDNAPEPVYMAVNTTVAGNENLLALVTEVY